jgi:hypothetical protein
MLLTQPASVIPAKAGIQENKDFPDPGFNRGDVNSTTWMQGVPPSDAGGHKDLVI